jgi:hypothetical protein
MPRDSLKKNVATFGWNFLHCYVDAARDLGPMYIVSMTRISSGSWECLEFFLYRAYFCIFNKVSQMSVILFVCKFHAEDYVTLTYITITVIKSDWTKWYGM